jgi:hypothetical protein
MNASFRVAIVVVSLAWISPWVVAQAPDGQGTEGPQLRSPETRPNDHVITLDAVVVDKSGHPVPGLHAEDFTVLDAGQPTKILRFRAHNKADVPANAVDPSTEIILVLDEVNAPYNRVAYAREGG